MAGWDHSSSKPNLLYILMGTKSALGLGTIKMRPSDLRNASVPASVDSKISGTRAEVRISKSYDAASKGLM